MIFKILYGVVDPTKLRFIATHFYLSSQFHAIGKDIKLMEFEIQFTWHVIVYILTFFEHKRLSSHA